MDALFMRYRRQQWMKWQESGANVWTVLSSDASPQGGLEYFVTLEDRITNPGLLIDSSAEDIAEWSKSSNMQTSTLALCVIGSGNAGTAAKFEALLHSVMMDEHYLQSVLGYCSDYGVEGHLTEELWLKRAFMESGCWLLVHFVEGACRMSACSRDLIELTTGCRSHVLSGVDH